MELGNNLVWIVLGVVVLAILAFLLLKPRQSVRLSDSAPLRPHMAQKIPHEGRGIADEVSAATTDIAGEILEAQVHENIPGGAGSPDDLTTLKGVGPRFAQLLNERGIVRFEQLGRLSAGEIERLDSQLGPFRGRLQRDRIVEQADYLGRGDTEGFEQRFGKL